MLLSDQLESLLRGDLTSRKQTGKRSLRSWSRISSVLHRYQAIMTNLQNFKKTGRRLIPRCCRVEYIPGLTRDSSELYDEYVTMFEEDPFSEETAEVGKKVMESISQERRKTWHTLIEITDMSKNCKKAWSSIRKLLGDLKAPSQQPKVTANQTNCCRMAKMER